MTKKSLSPVEESLVSNSREQSSLNNSQMYFLLTSDPVYVNCILISVSISVSAEHSKTKLKVNEHLLKKPYQQFFFIGYLSFRSTTQVITGR